MLRLGAAVDYGKTDIRIPAVGERGRVTITEVAGFARVGAETGAYMAFGGGYGWGHDTTDVSPSGADATSIAREKLHLGWATGELGWRAGGMGRLILTPVLGAAFTQVHLDGFAEPGSDFALSSSGTTVSRSLAWAGLNAAVTFGSERIP